MSEIAFQIDGLHMALAGLVCLISGIALVVYKNGKPQAAAQPSTAQASTAQTLTSAETASCLQLLALLQTEARLLDFISEDIDAYSDDQVGAAARSVHKGVRSVLSAHFELTPVRSEAEGARLTLPEGYDNGANRVVGNVVGQPPFHGTLVHAGWRANQVNLPQVAKDKDLHILVPAEIEL